MTKDPREEHSNAGRSIMEMFWEQADAQYAKFVDMHAKGEGFVEIESLAEALADGGIEDSEGLAEQASSYYEQKGKLATLAWCIAKMTNPYAEIGPAMEEVKQEMRDRYEPEEEDG